MIPNSTHRAGGWESLPAAGGKDIHVTATTPTPPIAHNAPHTKGWEIIVINKMT